MTPWRLCVGLAALLLAAAAPAPRPQASAAEPAGPKVVIQLGHVTAVDAAVWSPDGRWLLSVDLNDGALILWNPANGEIVDHLRFPALDERNDFVPAEIHSIAADADRRTIHIRLGARGYERDADGSTADDESGRLYDFDFDLATRRFKLLRPPARVTFEQAVPGRQLALPASPDGTRTLTRDGRDLAIAIADGKPPRKLTGVQRGWFFDADIAPNDTLFLRLIGIGNPATKIHVEVLDLATGVTLPRFVAPLGYTRARWIDDTTYAVYPDRQHSGVLPLLIVSATGGRKIAEVPSRCGMVPFGRFGNFIATASEQCPKEGIGAGAGGLWQYSAGPGQPERPDSPRRWRPLDLPAMGGKTITALAEARDAAIIVAGLQPDRPRIMDQLPELLIVKPGATRPDTALLPLTIEDAMLPMAEAQVRRSGDIDHAALEKSIASGEFARAYREAMKANRAEFDKQVTEAFKGMERSELAIQTLRFSDDGASVFAAVYGSILRWDVASKTVAGVYVTDSPRPELMASDSRTLMLGGGGERTLQRFDLKTASALFPAITVRDAFAGGYLRSGAAFWAASRDGAVRFWKTADASKILTLFSFSGDKFFVTLPDGRYDTNLPPDTSAVRWLMPDALFEPLPPQMFLRDYFEPGVIAHELACVAANDCAATRRQLRDVTTLNRVLPLVKITAVTPSPNPGHVLVTVDVRNGVQAAAANNKTSTEAYGLRLFRDGRLVAVSPMVSSTLDLDLDKWRDANRIVQPAWESAGKSIEVPMPTGQAKTVFSAYAFNEDRVKSRTASFTYQPTQPIAPRPRRAFVVTIGIDTYDEPRLKLRYASRDAALLGSVLATIPGYDEVHRVMLASTDAAGKPRRVTKAMIVDALGLLRNDATGITGIAAYGAFGATAPGTFDPRWTPDAARQRLADAGIDTTPLEPVTPDDVVIVTFAGHGWAAPDGEFYLVPADGRWPDGAARPDTQALISSAELTDLLIFLDAADIALVIDACHSAAAAQARGFRPGPMGDRGLGQLAYDKGVRVLAATKGDDVAFEDDRLKQGLLTYALAAEGLSAQGPSKADLDGDGRITLDEWLRYATRRLPDLSRDVQAGRLGGGATGSRDFAVVRMGGSVRAKLQEPALFDYNPRASAVVLRRQAVPPAPAATSQRP